MSSVLGFFDGIGILTAAVFVSRLMFAVLLLSFHSLSKIRPESCTY